MPEPILRILSQVFEDEAAGEVLLPLASLGAERRVYLGRSIEGVLRHRTATQLTTLFKRSFVCIRRFRTSDRRLLPLVLDPPRLLKCKADPSALALHVGLTHPLPAVCTLSNTSTTVMGTDTALMPAIPLLADPPAASVAGAGDVELLGLAADQPMPALDDSIQLSEPNHVDPHGVHMECALEPQAASAVKLPPPPPCVVEEAHLATEQAVTSQTEMAAAEACEDAAYSAALVRGIRLFGLYVAAGGALCMRHTVWRRLMPAIHRALT